MEEITPISSDRHVRLTLVQGRRQRWYRHAVRHGRRRTAALRRAILSTRRSTWRSTSFAGRRTVQLTLKRRAAERMRKLLADQKLLNLYNTLHGGRPADRARRPASCCPADRELVAVWRHIVSRAEDGRLTVPFQCAVAPRRHGRASARSISASCSCVSTCFPKVEPDQLPFQRGDCSTSCSSLTRVRRIYRGSVVACHEHSKDIRAYLDSFDSATAEGGTHGFDHAE